jgi:hypothetical protein
MSRHNSHEYKKKKRSNDIKYNIYYGIPHTHTVFSTGKGTPIEAFKYAKSKKLNFLIVTDHGPSFKGSKNLNGEKVSKWNVLKTLSEKLNKKYKSFVAIPAFECKINSIGDINIYNSKSFLERSVKRLSFLLSWMENENSCIASINHPHGPIDKLFSMQDLNKYIRLIEVGNGSYPYTYKRYHKQYFNFLDKGWKLGAIIGQDNHIKNWGDDDTLTGVLVEKLTEASIIDAFKNLRTYATESKSLKIIYKINNEIMGRTINCSAESTLKFNINLEDKKIPIEKLEIISNGGTVVKAYDFSEQYKLSLSFDLQSCVQYKWYVLKISQQNNRESLTSPIFINTVE